MIKSYMKNYPNKALIVKGGANNCDDIERAKASGADFVLLDTGFLIKGPYVLEALKKKN